MSSGEESLGKKKKKHKRRKEKKIDSGLVSCFGRIGVPARSVNFLDLVTNAQLIRSSTSIICLATDLFKCGIVLLMVCISLIEYDTDLEKS